MKIRESGMPDEAMWDTFFKTDDILTRLHLSASSGDVVDFGCGYGTFTLPAARMTRGTVYAFDIEPDMVSMVKARAHEQGLRNIKAEIRDFIKNGTGLDNSMIGYAILFNILHAQNPMILLQEAHRILSPGGRLGVIHWNYDSATPRGPSMQIRPTPEQCGEWMTLAGFNIVEAHVDLPPYHYGIVAQKPKLAPL